MTWLAFRTAPLKEFAVESALSRAGLMSFVPREIKHRRMGPKRLRQAMVYPMLPRYLFVRDVAWWPAILEYRHVQGVIGFGGEPARIPDKAMDHLKAISLSQVPTRFQSVHKAFAVGDTVEIGSGPFQGYIVPVMGIDGPKAKVILTLFGTKIETRIPLDNLEAA